VRDELPRLDPLRHSLRRLLLEERAALEPLAPALHRERPVAQVRQDPFRDTPVIGEEISLGHAVVREEHPVGAAQLDASRRLSHSTLFGANPSQSLLKYAQTTTRLDQTAKRCAHSSSSDSL